MCLIPSHNSEQDYNKKLEPTQDSNELFDPTLYRSYVGAIQYAVCGCRIDCCFTVREMAKHMVKPNVKHEAAVEIWMSTRQKKGLRWWPTRLSYVSARDWSGGGSTSGEPGRPPVKLGQLQRVGVGRNPTQPGSWASEGVSWPVLRVGIMPQARQKLVPCTHPSPLQGSPIARIECAL